ncbi:GNAT family N-acetyltransferase [Halobacillus shinanisalinarum]|uniref:GNAT family N-acetyltransferase n=1 Tax=Halobacillus shinanisalinarum TaxID=2932258 RepID=A0ABY4GW55_9BACI|nr:GNAT family N-acetyltransferase [Halobacillus shinanisalinarum]UOQ92274.1 GNAT family N-acetyltransferase [Halobacillus shinanisalinarum]
MDVLYQGEVTNRANGMQEDFQVSRLESEHLSDISQVQDTVFEQLQVKESLQALTQEELTQLFYGKGLVLGVFVQEQLIAFRALLYPGDDEENLGRDLGLSKTEQMKVVHQEITCILPEYRGNGLQKKLAKWIMTEFNRTSNEYRYLCCTVFPTNYPSLKDKLAQGMMIAQIKGMYGGLLRYVLYKDLRRDMTIDGRTYSAVAVEDYQQQKQLLKNGYYGYGLRETDGTMMILFGKVL